MQGSKPAEHLPWRVSATGGKADTIANHCFYMIAMGKWPPGSRLPAVRQLETQWAVNRQTILKAYRMLTGRGLVHHKPSGSYYVAEQWPRRDFTRDRIELEHLYRETLRKIASETDMSPLPVLRMLVRMAEAEISEKPEVAFVECSRAQAADHAGEITERLHVPVIPLALDEIRGKRMRVPSHVKVVFTTSFHADELRGLERDGAVVAALPIEISPDLLAQLARGDREAIFLESDPALAHRTAKDAVWMMDIEAPHLEVTSDIAAFLDDRLKSPRAEPSTPLFLVPQKEWERLDTRWREHPSVRPISCKLTDAAWPIIGDTLRIPFGVSVRDA
jgi:DNA-binding transcriptional regulator YhcF (GntR family)